MSDGKYKNITTEFLVPLIFINPYLSFGFNKTNDSETIFISFSDKIFTGKANCTGLKPNNLQPAKSIVPHLYI
jgi:hypothetical protein